MCDSVKMGSNLKEPEEIFKDLFICMIDFEPQKNPKMLKCGHSFCKDCLVGLSISMRRSLMDIRNALDDAPDRLKCPVCREFTDVPKTGIDGLPNNTMLEKLGDRVKELKEVGIREERSPSGSNIPLSQSGAQLCHMSMDCKLNKSPAKYFCHNCAKNCCEECHSKHNDTFNLHKTVDLESDIACYIYCRTHQDEYISFFCMECKVPLCTLCIIHNDQCKNHCVVEIMEKDKVLEEREDIKTYLEDLNKSRDDVTGLSKQLEDLRMEVFDMYIRSEDMMLEARKLLLERIEQVWYEFEKQREKNCTIALKVLNNAQEEVNYQMSNYTSLITFIQQLLENRDRFQPLSLFNDLKHRIDAAKQDVPCLDVLVPEVPVMRLITTNPAVFTFAQVEEILLKPVIGAMTGKVQFQPFGYSDETTMQPQSKSSISSFFTMEKYSTLDWNKIPCSPEAAEAGFFRTHDNLDDPRHLLSISPFPTNNDDVSITESLDLDKTYFTRGTSNRWSCNTIHVTETGRCIELGNTRDRNKYGNMRRTVSDHRLAQKTSPSKKITTTAVKTNAKQGKSIINSLKQRFSFKRASKPVFHTAVNVIWKTSLKLSFPASASMFPANIGLSIEGQKMYILDASHQCIAIFSDQVQRGSISLKCKPSMQPCSLAVSFDGLVFCTDLSNKTIEVFSPYIQLNETWNCIPGDTPVGICVTPDGSSVVTICMTKHSHTRLCIYNQKGNIELNRRFPRPEDILTHPCVVVCNGEIIAVLDEKRNRLTTYDMEIHLIATISNPNLTLEGLCVGKDGEFYVSAAEDSDLLRFSAKLHLLGKLNCKWLKGIKKPHRLSSCCNEDGDILLAITTPLPQNEIGIILTDLTLKINCLKYC